MERIGDIEGEQRGPRVKITGKKKAPLKEGLHILLRSYTNFFIAYMLKA
jgi:hypothetical protein